MKKRALYCLVLAGLMPIILGSVSAGCDQNFYKTLRYNKQYTFSDEFNANSSDKWMQDWSMSYNEQYDYNQSSSFPQFDWTQAIINAKGKVAKGTTMSVIKATSAYPILAVPTSRSYDNLLLTYTIKYSTDEDGNNMYTHTECGHYEISWCGDGVVDSSYGEACDPKDSNKTGWGNGGCNSSCQPVTVAAPACNSSYHGQKLTSLVEGSHLCTEGTYSDFGFSDSTHKWTWKCGNTAGTKVDCWAIKPYCGDGVVDAGEACDPEASEWKNRTDGKTCSSTCTVIEPSAPVCNSSYHGQRLTSLVEGSHLCTEGTYSNFEYSDSTHKWTWKCGNAAGTKVDCWATKPYCGDGVKDAGETCDPKDPNKTGWGNGGCDASCNPITVAGPSCNSSYHGQRLTSLTEGNHLCTEGTYSDFGFSDSTHKWTWKCGNSLGTKVDCWATKPYCGDGVKDAGETCDPADTSHAGRSDLGCDASCNPIQPSGGCDETFYDKLRFGRQYTFYDDYNAGSSDKWLRNWTMEYTEQYDYNKSSSFPSFAWTTNLVNNNYKVPANTSMRVLQATSTYPILAVPAQRAYDNLFIKYTITSSTDSAGTNKHAHSECGYYEISRCGDGILDTDYDETCDPKDPNKTGWGNGGCDAECKPVTAANGTPKIEKTLKDKKQVKEIGEILTWEVKVWAEGGDVTDFQIEDIVPAALKYKGYTVKSNTDNLTVNNPTGPVMSGEDSVYTWNVKGTLKKDHQLIIEVTTEVVKMPKSNDDYRNVACVIKDNNKDCDDDKPDPTNGTPKIEKTLEGKRKVESTGEILTWEVKVWAEGGDVTDFQIEDIVPAALKYKSYKVKTNPDNLTVNNPTGPVMSGEDSVYIRDVKGTLKEAHQLIIEVTTEVVKMPKSNDDYRNVACVIKDNKKDCDDDKPDPSKGYLVPDKTLIGSKEIKNTGDVVKWSLKVTAKGGDVTDVVITDKLPPVLAYNGFEVKHSGGLDISNYPTSSTFQSGGETWTKIVWNAKGTLKENDYVEIILTTYAKEMPSKDYNNVLCVRPEGVDPNDEDCDDEPVPSPDPRIKKTFTDGSKIKVVAIGDEIGYKITFGNKGTASATITSIKDFLPKNVKYVSSKIFMVAGVNSQDSSDGTSIDIYGGITLEPNAEGYIILTGTILGEFTGSTQNLACIYLNDDKIECDDAIHTFTGKLMCTKPDITTTSFTKAGGSTDVVCKTSPAGEKADSIELDCGNGTTFTGSNISSLSGTCTYPANTSSSSKSYSVVCKVNNETSDICKSAVSVPGEGGPGPDDPYCKAPVKDGSTFTCESTDKVYAIGIDCDHVVGKVDIDKEKTTGDGSRDILSVSASCNQDAKVQCYVKKNKSSSWETKTSGCGRDPTIPPGPNCFPAGTQVTMADGTKKNIEDVKEGDIVLSYNTDTNTNEGNIVKQKFVHKDSTDEMYELTINGKVLRVTYAHKFYALSSMNNGYDWIEAKDLKVGDKLFMSDGSYAAIENITHYANIETVYNFEVENNHNYFVAEGYLVHNRKGPDPKPKPDPDPVLYDSAACFNVNTNNISIEQGEILPFFWNISNLENNKDIFVVLGDEDYGDDVFEVQKEIISKYQDEECTKEEDNAIVLNSMLCDFKIRDGNGKVVYESQFPCLRGTKGKGNNWVSDKGLLDAWMKYGKNKYSGDGKYKFFWSFSNSDRSYALRSNLNYIPEFGLKDKNGNTINTFGEYKLSLTKIEYLQCRDGNWTWRAPEITACENDFALTNSYTVQKTPSGNLKASTTELDKYLYMNGKTALKASDLLKATIATSDYAQNDAVNKAMNNFVNKYQKLAVSVDGGMKKVPGKSIYFVEGDKVIKDGAFTKPTTFVQMDPSKKITIEGNIENLNIMVLTRGTIVFKDTNDCNPVKTQSRQTVKGIFYGEKGLRREGVLKNTDINASRRCTQGGLTIKGVLIGKGFDGLMKDSRSNLNNWFGSSQKKNIVMNGASVLIEYAPSVFTKGSMPPGAEDFTTALSIYKN